MNPIALYLASGESLYAGALLLFLLLVTSRRMHNRWLILVRNLLAWTGLAMVVLASPPIPVWFWLAVVIAYICWFLSINVAKLQAHRGFRIIAAVALMACMAGLVASEFRYRFRPTLTGGPFGSLYVVGDSISSGLEAGYPPWPSVFATNYGATVINLSHPGIGTEEAIPLARTVIAPDAVVLVEIGGNDLLAGLPSDDFRRHLDTLLATLSGSRRRVMMMELPLFPHVIGYGRVQRELAAKYGVSLIPKRDFIAVLSGADATSDGLHLSRAGTERMAVLVHDILGASFRGAATQVGE
jgi:lysophospholipase L1-like esterase